MSEVFGNEYAASYDALYADKDYDAECDLLVRIFTRAGRPVKTVLDLGCGTGAHSVRLAQRGLEVVGVDLSDGMLTAARRRADDAGPLGVSFVSGDIRSIRMGRQFDAVICMFAVLGYQTSDEDVAKALETVRTHLAPRGSFVFDVWYGPAVEATGPSARTKRIVTDDGVLVRSASASLEPGHICAVSYRLTRRREMTPAVTTNEMHRMRYFFEDELKRSLESSDLEYGDILAFPDTDDPVGVGSWNVLITASG